MSLNSSTTRGKWGCQALVTIGGVLPPLLVLCPVATSEGILRLKVFECVPLQCLGTVCPSKTALSVANSTNIDIEGV